MNAKKLAQERCPGVLVLAARIVDGECIAIYADGQKHRFPVPKAAKNAVQKPAVKNKRAKSAKKSRKS